MSLNNGEKNRVEIGGYKVDSPEAVGGAIFALAALFAGVKRFMQMGIGQDVADQVTEIARKQDEAKNAASDARTAASRVETKMDHLTERLADHFRDDDRRFGELMRRLPPAP